MALLPDYDALFAAETDAGARRRLWRQLAHALHPDRNPEDPSAARRFRAAKAAYRRAKDVVAAPVETAPAAPAWTCPCCREAWSFPASCPRCDVDVQGAAEAVARRDAAVEAWLGALAQRRTAAAHGERRLRHGAGAVLGVLLIVQLGFGLVGLAAFSLFGLGLLAGVSLGEASQRRRTLAWMKPALAARR
ncbi:MAG: hypothetical protein AAGH15_14395 [Myxococcota bacterium]